MVRVRVVALGEGGMNAADALRQSGITSIQMAMRDLMLSLVLSVQMVLVTVDHLMEL
jgi:cell division GTPase FtsZ